MANFPINNSTTSYLTNLDKSAASTVIPMNYTLNTANKFIYCNYPETIPTNALGDKDQGNACLNQVSVSAGEHQMFFSYIYNQTGSLQTTASSPVYLGIQIYNPNSSSLTYQSLKSGYGTNHSGDYGSWHGVAGKSFIDFFASASESSRSIASNSSYWLVKEALPAASSLISGSIRFTVSKSAIITVYVYKSLSKIDGTATPYPKSGVGGQYSGYGNGYVYTADTVTLTASEMNNGKYFLTNYTGMTNLKVNNVSKTSDLLPITLANPSNTTISPSTSNSNLGNWGVIYSVPIKLVNDTSSAKTFKGFIRTDTDGSANNYVIINSGSTTKYATLSGTSTNAWNWMTQTVAANSTFTATYNYVLGTNSQAGKRHMFTVE